MFRYFIQLAYRGTRFHGWQIQPNAISVQEELNKALSVLTRETVNVVGAGRTDTGVHASFFVAHVDLQNELADPAQLAYKMNAFLPDDIRIDSMFLVEGDFHARFSAVSRTYRYYIASRKELFQHEFSHYVPYNLDLDKMNEAAKTLFDYTDFTSFSKLHTDVKTNNCVIMDAFWSLNDNGLLVFEVKADRFLRNMVRAMVGTLLEVGKGRMSIAEFKAVLEQHHRGAAGASVAAKGLFLCDIVYPDPINACFYR
ncbi:MAG TPA: tRNA pseudouridine(38-40) synthase TruA [Prolixibacteraceae bacterium]|nr:tRNA pseudouridine(38-40) synthase TruA [Prolixibacteraceae bacterium]